MRLIDVVIRQGHLSERALVDAVTTGARPHHLDRCDICAERAVELARWMDAVKSDAVELSDAAFTPERLAAQQHQILRRLEQLDHPARVISFPAASRHETRVAGRRVAVSWVGIAAAAGLVIGLVGGQVTARLSQPAQSQTQLANSVEASLAITEVSSTPGNPGFMFEPLDDLVLPSQTALSDITPKLTQAGFGKSNR